MKTRIIIMFVVSFLAFSCKTQEERLREFVEQEVVDKAEDYLISQAIVNYVKGEANDVITGRANYWYKNFDHDWTWFEREMYGDWLGFAKYTGSLHDKFDERMGLWAEVYNIFINIEDNYIAECKANGTKMDTCHFLVLLNNHSVPYTIEEIGNLFFKPTRNNFHKITDHEYGLVYESLIGLGIETYQHDVVDDIRITKEAENLWGVDIVYLSGKCLNITVIYKNNKFMTKDTPWRSDVELFELDSILIADSVFA